MGNEGSAPLHPSLSPQDLAQLRATFPNPTLSSLWPPWTKVLDSRGLEAVTSRLRGQTREITFQAYQQLAGEVARGSLDTKVKFLLVLACCPVTRVTLGSVVTGVDQLLRAFCRVVRGQLSSQEEEHGLLLARSLTHDLAWPGEKRKVTFKKKPEDEDNRVLSLDQVEELFLAQPLLEQVLGVVVEHCFQLPPPGNSLPPILLPAICPEGDQTQLTTPQIILLNSHLPHEVRKIWRPLFNTDTHGESFAKFAGAIQNQGPNLVVVWDDQGNVFGGFASHSWKLGPKFYGGSESFLFHLEPKINVYETTPFNQNYQYFNLKQKTMPNGLGMGGQLDYFGFWIDSEFGLVKTSPTCSSFHSAALGGIEGKIRRLEVIGVGELSSEDEEGGPSVLDLDPEAQAVLEMMGKTFHSKVIREVDQEEERKKEMNRNADSK